MSDIPSLPHSPSEGDLERFNAAVDDARFAWAIRRCPEPDVAAVIAETSGLEVDCEPVPADTIEAARYCLMAVLAMPGDWPDYDDHYASIVLWNTRQRPDDTRRELFERDVPKSFKDLIGGE